MIVNGIQISKAFLESGRDLRLLDNLVVRHPSLEDILSLGSGVFCEDVYWGYVFSILSDPYDNMVWLDDRGKDYEKESAFDVFIMRWDELATDYLNNKAQYEAYGVNPLESVKKALKFFLGDHDFDVGVYDSGERILYDRNDKSVHINRQLFDYISTFVQIINGINRTDRINPANKHAKKILIEDTRAEQKKWLKQKKSENDDYIGNMIAGVVHGGNGGITPFNVCQLKIYQLYSSCVVDQKKSHYNHLMTGVYQGTVKFDKINKQELNWME